jgi:hypothetical protein
MDPIGTCVHDISNFPAKFGKVGGNDAEIDLELRHGEHIR